MARSVDNTLLSEELNKLKKDQLIDIIVYQKLPCNIKSELLTKYVMVQREKVVNNEKLVCQSQSCVKTKGDVQTLRNEIETMQKLIFQLEKRAKDQEDLIYLLKETNNIFLNNTKTNDKPSTSNQSNNIYKRHTIEKHDHDKTDHQQKSYSEVTKTEQVKTFQKDINTNMTNHLPARKSPQKRHKYKPIIGNNNDVSANIKTIPKKGYLHVCRLHPDTASEELLSYLKITAPTIAFECEEFNKTQNTKSFKVIFPIEHCKEIYNPKIWPNGAAVRRFTFRKKNFQEATIIEREG